RFEHQPTILTFSPSTDIICNNPDMKQFPPISLGKSYIIRTTTGLLNFDDLLALIVKLPKLTSSNQIISLTEEEELQLAKESKLFQEYWDIEYINEIALNQNHYPRIRARIHRGEALYSVFPSEQTMPFELPLLESPFAPLQHLLFTHDEFPNAFVSIACSQGAILANAKNGLQYPLEFKELLPQTNYIHNVRFYHFPEMESILTNITGAFGMVLATYLFDLNALEWKPLQITTANYTMTDSIANLKSNNLLIPSTPVFDVLSIKNADAVIENPLAGWGPEPNFLLRIGNVIVLSGVALAVILLLFTVYKLGLFSKLKHSSTTNRK
ncbi:MAG TPA: hypothetical protein VLH16_03500, partial [Bacteroidales bacterium]|nr:hypothetical protein [Bacteroidales bacterium]